MGDAHRPEASGKARGKKQVVLRDSRARHPEKPAGPIRNRIAEGLRRPIFLAIMWHRASIADISLLYGGYPAQVRILGRGLAPILVMCNTQNPISKDMNWARLNRG